MLFLSSFFTSMIGQTLAFGYSARKMAAFVSDESSTIQVLIDEAKSLYEDLFPSSENSDPAQPETGDDLICTVAPGRVNLIGEHTDYTGGFVFPMAIGYSTVCVGQGSIVPKARAKCKVVSVNKQSPQSQVITFEASKHMKPLPFDHSDSWTNYVAGVVDQYMAELPDDDHSISFQLAINGDVPLGSGLSSSAALEVAVATFIEKIMKDKYPDMKIGGGKEKALRCQKAENVFCSSPCGIMDQYVSATAASGSAILIDCRSLDYESIQMGETSQEGEAEKPVFLICNSNVKHSIGGGEYPVRVKQCAKATEVLQSIHGDDKIKSLRDATVDDVEIARKKVSDEGNIPLMDDLTYRRAKHVTTENERTQQAKIALTKGDWIQFGKLMNESHESMKTDYEVSCDEIDILVDLAQNFDGVYGSRLTGGGFGGCTVTLVERARVSALCEHLKREYKAKTGGNECFTFVTSPGPGARELSI